MAEIAQPFLNAPAPEQLECPSCHTSISYYDVQGSSFYGCPVCHAFFEYEYEGPPVILRQFEPTNTPPLIPIGTPGIVHGKAVRVVGYMRRAEQADPAEWSEYMLLVEGSGYWQLSEYNGHWMVIQPAEKRFSTANNKAIDNDQSYTLYHQYQPKTVYAVGEFDWNILEDDALHVSEYIAPPRMLVQEIGNTETNWYRAEYKTPQEISTAFGLDHALPTPVGVGAIEPTGFDEIWKPLRNVTIAVAILMVAVQSLGFLVKPARKCLDARFTSRVEKTQPSSTLRSALVSPPFDVDGPAALKLQFSATLNNQWLELPISLINEKTGKTYELTKVMEYYRGYESGESWSEGNTKDVALLSRIPSGRYHLNLYPSTDKPTPVHIRVIVTENTTLTSNLVLFAIAILIYPLYQLWRSQYKNYQRWQNSNFGPNS
ncbi:DUF4178 domain-containing protein [Tellurirhabdus bombi]|uniref:DUF4178 domain-containing protein n=1 Tax=Tellurirhabdus bombi TaxID=2907205 RepID=UPI001F32ED3C|nr:DUF4178 domain-containing protein [Tellurirhabdus bombi]